MHVFIRLLDFILIMHDRGFYHSDIKPENITLFGVAGQVNQYEAKVIDMGGVSYEYD